MAEAKRCRQCDIEKAASEFNKSAKHRDGLQSYCRECTKANYWRNRELRIAQAAVVSRRRRGELQQIVKSYLEEHPCVDCGEADVIVLEFDHVRGSKITEVSTMVADLWGIQSILSEIEKCEVRCANCHRRKTARELGWKSWINS